MELVPGIPVTVQLACRIVADRVTVSSLIKHICWAVILGCSQIVRSGALGEAFWPKVLNLS